MVFEAKLLSGRITTSDEGEEVTCFKEVPDNTIESQANFLRKYLNLA